MPYSLKLFEKYYGPYWIILALVLAKVPYLHEALVWDELYAYSSGVRQLFHNGFSSLSQGTSLNLGHAPGQPLLQLIWAKFFGLNIPALRSLNLFGHFLGLVFLFKLSKDWITPQASLLLVVLYALTPIVHVQSSLLLPDLFSCSLVIILCFLTQRNYFKLFILLGIMMSFYRESTIVYLFALPMSFLLDRKKLTKWFLGSLLAVTPLLIFFVWNFSKAKSGQVWPGFSDEFFSLKPMDILGNLFNIFYFNFLKVNYRFLITLPLIGFLGFQINNALKTKVWSLPPVLTATIFGSSLLCLGFSPYLVMERNILPFLFGYYLLLFYILELHVKSRYLPLLVTIILTLSFIPQYHPKVPVHEELNKTPIVVKAIAQDGRTYSYRDEIRVTKMAVEFLEKHRDKNLYVTWPFDLVLSDPFYGYTFKKYSNIFPKVSPFKKRVNAPAPDLLLVSNFSTPLNLQEQQIDIEKFKMRPLRTFKANGRYIVLFTK